jgi:hypothetical protein
MMTLDRLTLIVSISLFAVSAALVLAGGILAALRLSRPHRPRMHRVAD